MKNTVLQDFYTGLSSDFSVAGPSGFVCRIRLNAAHPIYKGHFPQTPVVPGVCLTQIVKEILMQTLQKELLLTEGDNIKFLGVINPEETPELEITFQVKEFDNTLEVNASYAHAGTVFVKFKGKFRVVQ